MTDSEVMIGVIALGAAGLWVAQQNRAYQDKFQTLANASQQAAAAAQPIGRLAGTLDSYLPQIVGIADYWVHN